MGRVKIETDRVNLREFNESMSQHEVLIATIDNKTYIFNMGSVKRIPARKSHDKSSLMLLYSYAQL
jgi:hypothetical protein